MNDPGTRVFPGFNLVPYGCRARCNTEQVSIGRCSRVCMRPTKTRGTSDVGVLFLTKALAGEYLSVGLALLELFSRTPPLHLVPFQHASLHRLCSIPHRLCVRTCDFPGDVGQRRRPRKLLCPPSPVQLPRLGRDQQCEQGYPCQWLYSNT